MLFWYIDIVFPLWGRYNYWYWESYCIEETIIEIAWTLPSFSIVSILWYRNNLKVYNYVALISVAVYLISFVSVLPIVMHYDMRLLATQAELDIHVLGLLGIH